MIMSSIAILIALQQWFIVKKAHFQLAFLKSNFEVIGDVEADKSQLSEIG